MYINETKKTLGARNFFRFFFFLHALTSCQQLRSSNPVPYGSELNALPLRALSQILSGCTHYIEHKYLIKIYERKSNCFCWISCVFKLRFLSWCAAEFRSYKRAPLSKRLRTCVIHHKNLHFIENYKI